MKIYTRSGDGGDTSRLDGTRVSKSHPLIEAEGMLDELNAQIGLCLCRAREDGEEQILEALAPVQEELFVAGELLVRAGLSGALEEPRRVAVAATERLEVCIDAAWGQLPELKSFVLPGGCELSARLHVARCVCRRCERRIVAAREAGAPVTCEAVGYLNRLGDLLFALARAAEISQTGAERPFGCNDV
jgi:cob(I)alamin adenosyltransferase